MKFSGPINKFQTLGIYDYKFDEVGNVIVNSSSMEFSYNYLGLPLWTSNYDNKQIESYYDVNFIEFVPQEGSIDEETGEIISESPDVTLSNVQSVNQQLTEENARLKEKIDELISLSEEDPSIAENEAIKRVILDLRIALKQGKEDKEFSVNFPYTPLITD